MAHQTEIVVNGVVTEVTEFDHTAQEIDDAVDNLNAITGGATTPQAALAALGAGVRPSLVDNGVFVGPNLPINQRGATSWTTSGYHIDRWKSEQSKNGSIDADGFHIGAGDIVIQIIDDDTKNSILGKTVTVSILLSDGRGAYATAVVPSTITENYHITCGIGSIFYYLSLFSGINSWQVGRISNESTQEIVVVAVKTEIGDGQTLYYEDDNGVCHLLPQPDSDYATQLAKCQRYLFNALSLSNTGQAYLCIVTATSTTYAYGVFYLPEIMRVDIPSIDTDCSEDTPVDVTGIFSSGFSTTVSISQIYVYSGSPGRIILRFTQPDGLFVIGNQYQIFIGDQNTRKVLFVADL